MNITARRLTAAACAGAALTFSLGETAGSQPVISPGTGSASGSAAQESGPLVGEVRAGEPLVWRFGVASKPYKAHVVVTPVDGPKPLRDCTNDRAGRFEFDQTVAISEGTRRDELWFTASQSILDLCVGKPSYQTWDVVFQQLDMQNNPISVPQRVRVKSRYQTGALFTWTQELDGYPPIADGPFSAFQTILAPSVVTSW